MKRSEKGIRKFGLQYDWRWDKELPNEGERREQMCSKKERLTEGEAETRVHHMEKKYQRPFEAYPCPHCEKVDEDRRFHVGNSTKHASLADKYR